MKHIKTIMWLVILIAGITFLIGQDSTQSLAQQVKPRRDPQLIRNIHNEGNPEKYWLEVDQEPVTPGITLNPATEPPSWAIYTFQSFRDKKRWNIYTLKPDGTEKKLYTGEGYSLYPILQKNGNQIVLVSDWPKNFEIYAIGSTGNDLRRLTNDEATDNHPTWSPDGYWIAFQSYRTGNSDIFIMDGSGNNVNQLTNTPSYDGEPSWSPDGKEIVFVSDRGGAYELWVMSSDGSNPHQITSLGNAFTPDWSPDGDRIAFSYDSDGNGFYEVWLVDAEGSNLTKLQYGTIGTQDAWAPAWSPDGQWVGFVLTDWIYYHDNWYWTKSNMILKDLSQWGTELRPSTDNFIWRIDWAANDTLPPSACSVTSTSQQTWSELPVSFGAQDQGESGIAAYDGQARLPGGEWQDFVSWIRTNGAIYSGSGLGQVEFRCRAYDRAGNLGEWSTTTTFSPEVDALHPISRILTSPGLVRGDLATLSWKGTDLGSGIDSYDIYSRVGENGEWRQWLSNVSYTNTFFQGASGYTYFFRSQAKDHVGNIEPWQPGAQSDVTFYSSILTVTVKDQRGVVTASDIHLQPSAVYSSTQGLPYTRSIYLGGAHSYSLTVTSQGFATLPPAEIPTTQDALFHWALPPPDDRVTNGGFEDGTLDGWSASGSSAVITDTEKHTGSYALQLSTTATNAITVSQTLSIDNSIYQPTLSFFYRIPARIEVGSFNVKVSGSISATILSTAAGADQWRYAWADLTPFSGHAVTLTLALSGNPGNVQVDEIALGSWKTPLPESISPVEWPQGQEVTLLINGKNFQPIPEIGLGDISLIDVNWISSTQLSAVAPSDIPGGVYDLWVINPGGSSGVLPDAVYVQSWGLHLPMIVNKAGNDASHSMSGADWPMFGHDINRTGYNRNEPGASRYQLAWQKSIPEASYSSAAVSVADGVLLLNASYHINLLALDAETGDQLWNYTEVDGWPSLPTIANGLVYYIASASANNTHAFNLYSGAQVWNGASAGGWSPLAAEHRLFTTATDDIRTVNASTGSTDWSKMYGYNSGPGEMPAYRDGILHSMGNGNYRAINPKTGGVLWDIEFDPYFQGSYSPMVVVSDDTALIVKDTPKQLIAINTNTHEVLWISNIINSLHGTGWIAVADGTVYIADGSLSVFDIATGNTLWSFAGDTQLSFNPVVTQKYIIVSSQANTYVLDRFSHQIVWQTNSGGWLTAANGFLYVAATEYNYTLYAYRAQDP